MENRRLNNLEKSWIFYDVGNSAFILMVSTLIPIYFNFLSEKSNISEAKYLSYWGYAASFATIIVAILGPIFGSIADFKNLKKLLFSISILIGTFGCMILGVFNTWISFLAFYVGVKIAYSVSIIFYDSMINDVTTKERLDNVSSQGFGWGYIGSCVPFILCLVLVLWYEPIGISYRTAMIICFIIIGLWWLFGAVPLIKNYKQIYYIERENNIISGSFKSILSSLKQIKNDKKVMLFLIAYFFYIDGVYTIIEMATAYGKTLGLDSKGLLLALLVTQIVAFPCALFMAGLSKKYQTNKLIIICIIAYAFIAFFAFFISNQIHFWILAILVGMFQGGIQALSRSYFAKIIPKERSGEYFGILDICGKGASFMGTMLVAIISQVTGSANAGVGFLSSIFILGLIIFVKSYSFDKNKARGYKNNININISANGNI